MCTSSYTNTPKFILWLTDQTAHPRMPSSVLSSYKVGVLAYLVANPDKLPRRVRTPFRSLLDSMSLHCFPVSTNRLVHLGRSAAMDPLLRKTKAGECSLIVCLLSDDHHRPMASSDPGTTGVLLDADDGTVRCSLEQSRASILLVGYAPVRLWMYCCR